MPYLTMVSSPRGLLWLKAFQHSWWKEHLIWGNWQISTIWVHTFKSWNGIFGIFADLTILIIPIVYTSDPGSLYIMCADMYWHLVLSGHLRTDEDNITWLFQNLSTRSIFLTNFHWIQFSVISGISCWQDLFEIT